MKASWTMCAAAWVFLAWGCGTRDATPVGGNLLGGDPGGVLEMPLLPLSQGKPRFEGINPVGMGTSEELWVGQMSGLAFRTLLRFRVPADSLARAAGGRGTSDLEVTSLRVVLHAYTGRQRQVGKVGVHSPTTAWTESSVFADSLTLVEVKFSSLPIATANAVSRGDSLIVELPATVGEKAIRANPQAARLEMLLAPTGTEGFLKVLRSRETDDRSLRPRLLLSYSVGGARYLYEIGASADTYWGRRSETLPPDLLLASGVFYASLLRFEVPDSIPSGATVNMAQLLVDIDEAQSYYDVLPFRVDMVGVSANGDTTFAQSSASGIYVQSVAPSAPSQTFVLDRTLIQGWISGGVPNHGLALRPQYSDPEVDWVVFQNPRLRVVYSLPPSGTY